VLSAVSLSWDIISQSPARDKCDTISFCTEWCPRPWAPCCSICNRLTYWGPTHGLHDWSGRTHWVDVVELSGGKGRCYTVTEWRYVERYGDGYCQQFDNNQAGLTTVCRRPDSHGYCRKIDKCSENTSPGEFNMIHPSRDWTHPLIVVMATRSLPPYSFQLLTPIKSYVSELYGSVGLCRTSGQIDYNSNVCPPL